MKKTEMTPKLNLYVVGESSGNPAEWSQWGNRKMVVAATPEEACRLAEAGPPVAILECPGPCVVMEEGYVGV